MSWKADPFQRARPLLSGYDVDVGGMWVGLEELLAILSDRSRSSGVMAPLAPSSIRWDGSWSLDEPTAPTEEGPGPESGGLSPAAAAARRIADCSAVAAALVLGLCGRAPISKADARALASVNAGVLPVGFDAVIDALLQGDVPRAIAAHRLAAAAGSPASAGIASETLVGSRKANGRPTSNEDAVVWTARGTRALLVVCDGITGTGEGSGYRAAHAAVEAAASAWQATGDLDALRAAADQAATSAGGGATLVAVDFDAGLGSASILSLGDSSAWLVRANGEVTTAFRLSPIQTVHAALLVNDPHALGFESVLTHFLGGAAGQPYTGEIGTRPGDLLVVCSDGTDVDDSVESFASALSRIATEVRGAGRPVGPATAVELVIRAERVSGFDNATAAVVSFTG